MRCRLAATTLLLLVQSAAAQHAGHDHAKEQPYAGLETRAVASLPADEIAGLRAGRGLSLALPAELNGYPGPLHVLELAERLRLTPEQTRRTEALLASMRREAIALGEAVIAAESRLDLLFREKRATADNLATETAQAGATRAALRAAHLRHHLVMRDLLTEGQIALYQQARGYLPR